MRITLTAIIGLLVGALAYAQQQPDEKNADQSQQQQQVPYEPAVPQTPVVVAGGGYGGWGQYHHASTAAEGAARGMADMVRAQGDYNLSTSAAMINVQQARSQAIRNQQDFADTYFAMRASNRAYREAERGPRPTEEQMIRMAQAGVPQRPATNQLNPVSGHIQWPAALEASSFSAQRSELDKIFAERVKHGGLTIDASREATRLTDEMLAELKADIRNYPTNLYLEARRFLQSLAFEARLPAG